MAIPARADGLSASREPEKNFRFRDREIAAVSSNVVEILFQKSQESCILQRMLCGYMPAMSSRLPRSASPLLPHYPIL